MGWSTLQTLALRAGGIALAFLLLLCLAGTTFANSLLTLAPKVQFSSLLERGSNANAMGFNSTGDLYFHGWSHGLERAAASELPDGAAELLLEKSDYLPFFGSGATTVVRATGVGVAFAGDGRVISYINGESDAGKRVGFARCNPDGSNLEPLDLMAGEDIPELGLNAGDSFSAGTHQPFQMVLATINGQETLIFTLWGLPQIFQVPATGGLVTTFCRFASVYPWQLTLMGDDLIVTHKDGNIYRIGLADRLPNVLATKAQLLEVLGADSGNIRFIDLDYEPVSDHLYCVAQIWWDDTIPQTLLRISPDGTVVDKLVDVNELTNTLAGIRTPPPLKTLEIGAMAVNPAAVAAGEAALFLGDYWSGLMMVRLDLPLNRHTVDKNIPTGALVDLDLGSGSEFLCFGPFGRLEGAVHLDVFLPEGANDLRLVRDGVIEEYRINVVPAFNVATRAKRNKVQLTWPHAEENTLYEIYRSTAPDADSFVKIGETTSTYATYLDYDTTYDVAHLYAVAAVSDAGKVFSTVAAATPSRARRPGNADPTIYSGPPPAAAWSGSPFTFRLLAVDSSGDGLTFDLAGEPAGMTITDDGTITWFPDADQTGTYQITVLVSDGRGGQVSQTFNLEVTLPVLRLVGLEAEPTELAFNDLGQTEPLTVAGIYNDGSRRDLTAGLWGTVYRPDGGSAVRVDGNGLVTAQNSGFAEILVANHGMTASAFAEVDLPPVIPLQARLDAADALQADNEGIVRVRWNLRNGTIHSIHVLGDRLTPPSYDDPLAIAKDFLLGQPELFGLVDLAEFPLENQYITAHSGVTHIVLRQHHAGIPFYGNSLSLHVDRFGQVISISGNYDPVPVHPSSMPAISAEEAVTIVANRLAPLTPYQPILISGPEGTLQETVFEAGPFNADMVASLRWLSMADCVHLSWWVLFFNDENYCVAQVDAHTGCILQVADMAVAAIPGKVFLQSPDKVNNVPASVMLPDRWFDLSDPAIPYPSYGENARVEVRNGPVSQGYSYLGMSGADSFGEDFLNSWRNSGTKWVKGEDVNWIMGEDGYWEDFHFTAGNVFYWMNHLHDYFNNLGFDRESRSMEAGNYGLGTARADIGTLAYVRGAKIISYAFNNACASYWTNGSSDTRKWTPFVQYGLFYIYPEKGSLFASDLSLDPDSIIHEYVHNVSNALIGGTTNLQPMCDNGLQAEALAEAFSDFFACSLTDDPVYGDYETGNSVKGERIWSLQNPYADYGDVFVLKCDKYAVSLVFSTVLWDLRTKFIEEYGSETGRARLERLVIDALGMMPEAPDMLDARDAILDADSTTECGAHQQMLWEVFANRRFGYEAETYGPRDVKPISDKTMPSDYTRPPKVETAEIVGGFRVGVPVDIEIMGKNFTEESQVYILDTSTYSSTDAAFEHLNCGELRVTDYTFLQAGAYEVCVENYLYDSETETWEWKGECKALDTNIPVIDQITPSAGIPVNQAVSFEITGSNFTDVDTVTIVDPNGAEIPVAFVVVDDTRITIADVTFALAGEHQIRLTTPVGEASGTVLVVEGPQPAPYAITDLGLPAGSNYVAARGINSSGEVVGRMQYVDSYHNSLMIGFRWAEGATMDNLPPLPGFYFSQAFDINDSRDAVGVSYRDIREGFRGTIWHTDGTKTELPDLGGGSTYAYSINNAGLVVGSSDLGSTRSHAFLWQVGSGMTDLGTADDQVYYHSSALDVNNAGQIVGISTQATIGGKVTACLWSGGGIIILGNDQSRAEGINDAGLVVGQQDCVAHQWQGGPGGTSLGTLGGLSSGAMAVNNHGQVVGWSAISPTSGLNHAVLWEGGDILDLNDLHDGAGWDLRWANDINDAGQIVGWGYFNGYTRGFLLTPVE